MLFFHYLGCRRLAVPEILNSYHLTPHNYNSYRIDIENKLGGVEQKNWNLWFYFFYSRRLLWFGIWTFFVIPIFFLFGWTWNVSFLQISTQVSFFTWICIKIDKRYLAHFFRWIFNMKDLKWKLVNSKSNIFWSKPCT